MIHRPVSVVSQCSLMPGWWLASGDQRRLAGSDDALYKPTVTLICILCNEVFLFAASLLPSFKMSCSFTYLIKQKTLTIHNVSYPLIYDYCVHVVFFLVFLPRDLVLFICRSRLTCSTDKVESDASAGLPSLTLASCDLDL